MEMVDRLALARSMENMAAALTGLDVRVKDCTGEGARAYSTLTKKQAVIAVAFGTELEDLTDDEAKVIFYGFFAHEVMHLIRTDFSVLTDVIPTYVPMEQKDRKDIANICEDPAIEYLSAKHLSSFLCECLEKKLEYFHWKGPSLEEAGKDAYLQYIAAMIMFGDLGVLKGTFTFPEARDAFVKTGPKLLRLIEEPDSRKRFDMSQEIFEDIRPIWEEHANNAFANSELSSLLNSLGVTESSGDGSNQPGAQSGHGNTGSGGNSETSQRRRALSELLEQIQKELAGGSGKSETDQMSSKVDGDASPAASEGSADKQGIPGIQQNKDTQGDGSHPLETLLSALTSGQKMEPFKISQELAEHAALMYAAAKAQVEKELKTKAEAQEKDRIKPLVSSPYYGNVQYEVHRVASTDCPAEYHAARERLRPDIANFRALLKKIFRGSYIRKSYKTSGKINVQRCCGKKMTARVFEKRYDPGDKTDLSIVLMVDQSGSMRCRQQYVQDALILILEALEPFGIPVKVVGFATTSNAYDADYFHYGAWKNTPDMRQSIMLMNAAGSTFLGHAIRYGAELLKKRTERNRLYIVITDGEPCHRRYASDADGINDCKRAVAEVSKYADVIGIGLYDSDEDTFMDTFKDKAVIMKDPAGLAHGLTKMIAKSLKS